ncbi:MAG TPA: SUMF1/EgtB/PvdO family nonheme iron enzyme [Planctomycetota bacterium]|nr:SUMF1/EgtB/PvdO family nonheme iron enzyme [Planctomycetota bacterium]
MHSVTIGLALLASVAATGWTADGPSSATSTTPQPPGDPAALPTPGGSLPKKLVLELGGNVPMNLVLIPAGEFLMGSPDAEPGALPDEHPQRRVRITAPFYMGTTELTQAQWTAVLGTTIRDVQAKLTKPWPLRGEGPDVPMYLVRWNEAVGFCNKLSAKIGRPARLPTEAEWEYALRAGTQTTFFFGNDKKDLAQYARTRSAERDRKEAYPVAGLKPNPWGLHDMMGNVWEWCHDWYDKGYYAQGENVDPRGPASGKQHVLRGGAWFSYEIPRSAKRQKDNQEDRWGWGVGFRVLVEATARPAPIPHDGTSAPVDESGVVK